jgi:hypothetical protein
MSKWEVATLVGAEVRPEVVETEEETGETCVRSRGGEQGSAEAGAEELPERVQEMFPGRGRFHIHAGGDKSRPVVGTTALMD